MDAKVEKVLLQVRKGVYSGLTVSMLETVFGLMPGWSIAPEMVCIPAYLHKTLVGTGCAENKDYDAKGGEECRRIYSRSEDTAALEMARKVLAPMVVSELPAKPKLGKLYLTSLSEVTERRYSERDVEKVVTATAWEGAKGYVVTEPGGKTYRVTKRAGYKVLTLDDLYRWLREETSFVAEVLKLLGMEAHVPAAERTRENTGTCPCCFRNMKLTDEKTMVLHGYQRPGVGHTIGQCVGRGYAPYEMSCEGTHVIKKMTEENLEAAKAHLAKLESGTVESITETNWRGERVVLRKGEPGFERKMANAIYEAKSEAGNLEWNLAFFQKMIDTWEVRPLPEIGSPVPQYELR